MSLGSIISRPLGSWYWKGVKFCGIQKLSVVSSKSISIRRGSNRATFQLDYSSDKAMGGMGRVTALATKSAQLSS